MKRVLLALLSVFSLCTATLADPPSDRPRGHGRCVKQCLRDAKDCRRAARATLRDCAAACAPLREAAEAVCPPEPEEGEPEVEPSAECLAAIEALHACLRPCRVAFRDAALACLAPVGECLDECGVSRPPIPTPVP